MKVEKWLLMLLKVLFPLALTKRKNLKILTTKQILQQPPIVLAQVKGRNTSENLLNEICQIIYSLQLRKKYNKKSIKK